MTIDEFLVELENLPSNWQFKRYPSGFLRLENLDRDYGSTNECCPITAVSLHRTKRFYNPGEFDSASKAIGLKCKTSFAIARCSDTAMINGKADTELRKKLVTIFTKRIKDDRR